MDVASQGYSSQVSPDISRCAKAKLLSGEELRAIFEESKDYIPYIGDGIPPRFSQVRRGSEEAILRSIDALSQKLRLFDVKFYNSLRSSITVSMALLISALLMPRTP